MCSCACANFNVAYKLATIAASRSSVTYDRYTIHCAIAVSGYTAASSPKKNLFPNPYGSDNKDARNADPFPTLRTDAHVAGCCRGALGIFGNVYVRAANRGIQFYLLIHGLRIKQFENALPHSWR